MRSGISNPVAIALNERGAKTAVKLGLHVEIGKPGPILEEHWRSDRALVLVMALPIAVRLLAKRNLSKTEDPLVISVDESGRFIIPLLGGHKGSNRLAGELAKRTGGTAVITTSSELAGVAAVDGLSGYAAEGDVAEVIESMLDGNSPVVLRDIDWPEPIQLESGLGPAKVVISDSTTALADVQRPAVQLIPPSLVIGVGCSSEATAEDVSTLISQVCADNHLDRRAVSMLATIDTRSTHPALTSQNLPIAAFASTELAQVAVPNPSGEVNSYVGTPSVCEAAALLASKSTELLVAKTRSLSATVAVARQRPTGSLKLVGLGPGTPMLRTPAAVEAIIDSEVVIGYSAYIDQCQELLSARQLVLRSPIGEEGDRADSAISLALQGRSVAVVCSGDPEVYAMASITFEKLEALLAGSTEIPLQNMPRISVVPGVTAGLGGGALLGAPLGHDHAYISLSDLLTPWWTIEKRLHAYGEADVVTLIYNPKSRERSWQLPKAIEILSHYRSSKTPVAIVRNIGRAGESKRIFTLSDFDPSEADMTSLVIVGSTATRQFGDFLFTPRGYEI